MSDGETVDAHELDLLRRAAANETSGLDMRFEGGPWVDDLNNLVKRGLLKFTVHPHVVCLVSYSLTEAGEKSLARYGTTNEAT